MEIMYCGEISCEDCSKSKCMYKTTNKIDNVLDKIREEVEAIAVTRQVNEHTMFIRAGEEVKRMTLDIIDKYKAESEE